MVATGYTASPNGFTMTTIPNPDQGWLTPTMPKLSPLGSEKIEADVPSHDGVSPASGFVFTGSLMGLAQPWRSGAFYGTMGTTPVSVLTVASTLYAFPIFVPNLITVVSLNLNVLTGQTGGAAHLGIYADNGAGYPGQLIYDTGALTALTGTAVATQTLSTTAGAATSFNLSTSLGLTGSSGQPLSINQLTPGNYWLGSIFTASGTFISVAGATAAYGNFPATVLGSDTAAHLLAAGSEAATGLSVAGTYGALPTTFTTGGALILNAATPYFGIGV